MSADVAMGEALSNMLYYTEEWYRHIGSDATLSDDFKEEIEQAKAALSVSEAKAGEPVTLTYTNYRGETALRTIRPKSIRFGSTEWHPEPQWLLLALDVEKNADREFALKDFGAPTPPQVDREAVAREIVAGWVEDCEGEVQFNFLQSQQLQDRIVHALAPTAPAQEGE